MSRSYRAPVYTEGYGNKDKKKRKRKASRAVRAEENVGNGNEYKKHSCSWDICDFKFHTSDKTDWKVRRK